jgi:hypothetical protein
MKKLLLVVLAVTIYSPNGFSWGKTGHRIVGEIAEKNLNPKARKALKEIIGEEPLWRASTWADEIRSDPARSSTAFWHYVSIPTGKTYFDQKRNKDGDVIEALYRFEDILRDSKSTKDKKLEALKFIDHFLGDLHQPLHVGLAEDRGGNSIKVKWFKDESNLHTVWDEEIINFEQLSYSEYANFLNKYSDEEKKNWQKGYYLDWARESQELRPKVYDLPENKNLGYEYGFKMKPIIEERLRQAGFRLAYVLNAILTNEKIVKDEVDNRKKINENI